MLQTGQPTGACDCQFASSALCSPRGSPQRRTNGNCEQRSAKKVVPASVLPTLAAFLRKAKAVALCNCYNSSSARSRLLRAASVTAVTFARLLRARHSAAFMPKLLHAIILGLASVRSLSTTRRRIIIATPAATALPVFAADDDDAAARAAALQAKLAERRKLMELSRSSNDRQRYFDLSRQRASVVYNTTYRGSSCVPGLPCI